MDDKWYPTSWTEEELRVVWGRFWGCQMGHKIQLRIVLWPWPSGEWVVEFTWFFTIHAKSFLVLVLGNVILKLVSSWWK